MTNSMGRRVVTFLLLLASLRAIACARPAELPAESQVLDDKLIMDARPEPLVSPDGRQVAYFSRGYACVADIAAGKSRQLIEVPGTWSHVYAKSVDPGDLDSLDHPVTAKKYKDLYRDVSQRIADFQWTADSAAIVYSLSHEIPRKELDSHVTQVHVWRMPLTGEPKEIASGDLSYSGRRGPGGVITRDGRFLVNNSGRDRALIWDLATNKPRATPFLNLTPSPTSGRWLCVEKDTRQLVVVDEGFQVIARHDEIVPKSDYGFNMIWSPDERFVFWRQQIGVDYYSNWDGCRYDLVTRDRQIFTGSYMNEAIIFTGHRGEFLRVGASGIQGPGQGLTVREQYVGLVPDGRVHMQRFWHHTHPTGQDSMVSRPGGGSQVLWSPDLQLFTIGLARPQGPHGAVMHLADRHRHLWRLPGEETEDYVSPYQVAGFALDGESIISYDKSRLFSLPVSAIKAAENKLR
ncbi:hypothetical protein I41_09220 [Lacipirellula limnantheis]|uniref:Translocation protein TolB n=2 Tax=Lacipirellula limnantheis TaxID=2528024 RepID=A0A517TTS0_9BACT|nr:hypothetical protein I41_09220 [Lacipirellula limnantheis]